MSTRAVTLPEQDHAQPGAHHSARPGSHHTTETRYDQPGRPGYAERPNAMSPRQGPPAHPAHPAHPPRAARPIRKLTNKSPLATVIWILVLLALVVGIALGGWWFTSGRYGEIPTVLGMDKATAQATIEEAGFSSTLDERYDNDAEKNTVMGTDPAKGHRAVRGSEVAVLLSLGKPTVPDPGKNSSLQYYTKKLSDLTLKVKKGDDVYSEDVAKGHVAEVKPAAGSEVQTGSTIVVHMSKGKPPVTVPDVQGLSMDDARKALRDAGLNPVDGDPVEDSSEKSGHVAEQSPKAGEQVDPEKNKDVEIRESTSQRVPWVFGLTAERAKEKLEDSGFEVKIKGNPQGFVISQSPGPGSRSHRGATVTLTTI